MTGILGLLIPTYYSRRCLDFLNIFRALIVKTLWWCLPYVSMFFREKDSTLGRF